MKVEEQLKEAIKRGKKFQKMYRDIGRDGVFGLMSINDKLERAEKALKSGGKEFMRHCIEELNAIE